MPEQPLSFEGYEIAASACGLLAMTIATKTRRHGETVKSDSRRIETVCCYLDSYFCRSGEPRSKKLEFEAQSPEEVPNRKHGKSKGSCAALSCK